MKVTAEKRWGVWTVLVVQGHQSFRLDFSGTKGDAEWYAKMFRIALKAHDRERGKRAFRALASSKYASLSNSLGEKQRLSLRVAEPTKTRTGKRLSKTSQKSSNSLPSNS